MGCECHVLRVPVCVDIQLGVDRDDIAVGALGAAVLAHHPADQAFRGPVTPLQDHDGPAATLRAHKFPSAVHVSLFH
jgi:hypothetical protein